MASRKKEDIFVISFFVLGLIGFAILFIGLRGGLIGRRNPVNVFFDDISGLQIEDPVYVLGVEKGRVKKVRIMRNKVLVTLEVDGDIQITKDAKVFLRTLSYFTGGLYLKIDLGPGSPVTVQDTLKGENQILNIEGMIVELTTKLRDLNLDGIGSALGKQGENLVSEIKKGLKDSFSPLSASLGRVNNLTERVDSLFTMLGKQDGTINKLITSDELYTEILSTNKELKELIKDIKTNPKKYFNIKVF